MLWQSKHRTDLCGCDVLLSKWDGWREGNEAHRNLKEDRYAVLPHGLVPDNTARCASLFHLLSPSRSGLHWCRSGSAWRTHRRRESALSTSLSFPPASARQRTSRTSDTACYCESACCERFARAA